MRWLLKGLLAAGGLAAWASVLRARSEGAGADELHYVKTSDGWRIALSRWKPARKKRRHPVFLVHGLSATRDTWDLAPEASLARRLATLGWDVWAVELRGHGRSDRPSLGSGRRYDWSFDDHLIRDLPAALAGVRKATRSKEVHWIGHSMGGILLLARLARRGGGVRSGVAIGSSLDYSGSDSGFHKLTRFKRAARYLPVMPLRPFAFLSAPLAMRLPTTLETFNCHPDNIDPALYRQWLTVGVESVSPPVLGQLASAFEPGGLRTADDKSAYLPGLRESKTPVLFLAGDRDRQCPPSAARASHAVHGGRKKLVVFGPDDGCKTSYGHMDLVFGRRAPEEVWPVIETWLEKKDN